MCEQETQGERERTLSRSLLIFVKAAMQAAMKEAKEEKKTTRTSTHGAKKCPLMERERKKEEKRADYFEIICG